VIGECEFEDTHDEDKGFSDVQQTGHYASSSLQQRNGKQLGSRAISATVSRATTFASTGMGDAETKTDTERRKRNELDRHDKQVHVFGTHGRRRREQRVTWTAFWAVFDVWCLGSTGLLGDDD
jgi:hypothetical protein